MDDLNTVTAFAVHHETCPRAVPTVEWAAVQGTCPGCGAQRHLVGRARNAVAGYLNRHITSAEIPARIALEGR